MQRFVALLLILAFAGASAAFAQSNTVTTKDGDFLYVDNWRLPKSHQYQSQMDGNRIEVKVEDVRTLLVQKIAVFDRTSFEWVYQPVPAPAPVATVVSDGPDDKDDCKGDGLKQFTNPSFKNQGDCVSWTSHNGGKGKGKGK